MFIFIKLGRHVHRDDLVKSIDFGGQRSRSYSNVMLRAAPSSLTFESDLNTKACLDIQTEKVCLF